MWSRVEDEGNTYVLISCSSPSFHSAMKWMKYVHRSTDRGIATTASLYTYRLNILIKSIERHKNFHCDLQTTTFQKNQNYFHKNQPEKLLHSRRFSSSGQHISSSNHSNMGRELRRRRRLFVSALIYPEYGRFI